MLSSSCEVLGNKPPPLKGVAFPSAPSPCAVRNESALPPNVELEPSKHENVGNRWEAAFWCFFSLRAGWRQVGITKPSCLYTGQLIVRLTPSVFGLQRVAGSGGDKRQRHRLRPPSPALFCLLFVCCVWQENSYVFVLLSKPP